MVLIASISYLGTKDWKLRKTPSLGLSKVKKIRSLKLTVCYYFYYYLLFSTTIYGLRVSTSNCT